MSKKIKISRIVIFVTLISLFLLITRSAKAAESILIPISTGESVTIYEATGGHYEHTYSVSELMINGGNFSTNANEHYTITSNGTYLEINCFRDNWLSGHSVGNNIVAVRLNGVSGYPDGLWASSIIDYKLGYNGIAESRFNILGNVSAIGPYENSPCIYLGDQNSEITVGFSVNQRTVSELQGDIRNIQEKLVVLLNQLIKIYQEKILELQGTSNWQTYRNEEYGFEIKYPAKWRYYYSEETEPSANFISFWSDKDYFIEEERTRLVYISFSEKKLEEYLSKANQERIVKVAFNGLLFTEVKGYMGLQYSYIIETPDKKDLVIINNNIPGIIISAFEPLEEAEELQLNFNQILSTFRFIEKNIRDVDFIEYLTNVYYAEMGGPSEYCMSGRDPIIINYIKYYDLDNDGGEEAIIQAYTCFTGTAGPDINSIYKLLPTGEVVELKTNNFFQGKSVFDEHNWKNYGFDVIDGKLIDTVPVYNDNDSNCCPTGGVKEILYEWDGKEFVVTDVLFK